MTVPPTPLVTDFYQLTMMQGYLVSGISEYEACFDLFFRSNPFNGGYTIAAGLEEALRFLEGLSFSSQDISYLESLETFSGEFLDYLRTFKFTGTVHAVAEGTVVFPQEPILRVLAPVNQCQLVESALLNTINFQSLIATKAARVCQEAGVDNVLEFGLRRAQGVDGALTASRAAYIGGCMATSNVQAGKIYGIPVKGTHAHSWVTAFNKELEAFRKFVEIYPENSILLVDTFDTLRSGVPNAIKVGLEMKKRGQKLLGIRLDSGDLAFLSIEVRRMLDEAGLVDTKIVCSSELDENIIHDLKIQGAKIDIYGVGTKLVSADGEPALSGVFKMSAIRKPGGQWRMKLKKSEGLKKATLPGIKQVWRLYDVEGDMMADLVDFENKPPDFSSGLWGFHPRLETEKMFYDGISKAEKILMPVFANGQIAADLPALPRIRERVQNQLSALHPTMRRLLNPHIYKVSLGAELNKVTRKLREEAQL